MKEKRKKENQRKHQSTNGPYVDTSKFMGIDYDDSIFTPWLNEDGTMKDGKDESVTYFIYILFLGRKVYKTFTEEIFENWYRCCK